MEETLIQGCIDQEERAQKQVYQLLFGRMFAICMRYTKNESDAMEVLNSSFLKVFNRIDQYNFDGAFEGWVRSIVINTALDHLRSNFTYKEKVTLIDYEETIVIENTALGSLNMQEIYDLIRGLPPTTQTVFNLFAIDGFSHKEIGKKLKMNEGTSKWHVANARKILAMALKKNKDKKLIPDG